MTERHWGRRHWRRSVSRIVSAPRWCACICVLA